MILRLSVFFSLLFTSALLAGPAQIFLKIKTESENQTVNKKAPEEIRGHWLTVEVTNGSGTKLEGLTLKWTLYAQSLKRGANDIVVEKSGESKLSVDAGKHETVTTPKVTFTYTPMHSERVGRSSKKVDETGHRYHGYHVQVLNGDTVVGEAYSQEALKNLEK